MREIEFRGYDESSGLWRYGFLLVDGEKYYIIQIIQGKIVRWRVNPNTVGQFTGLLDKNGRKIYEGDIIRFVNGQKKVNGEWVDNEFVYTVEYSEGAFRGVMSLSKSLDAVEVIGNIHDTPELIL